MYTVGDELFPYRAGRENSRRALRPADGTADEMGRARLAPDAVARDGDPPPHPGQPALPLLGVPKTATGKEPPRQRRRVVGARDVLCERERVWSS